MPIQENLQSRNFDFEKKKKSKISFSKAIEEGEIESDSEKT